MSILPFLNAHSTEIFALLFSVSEILAYIPSVKGSGIFQVVHLYLASRIRKNG